MRLLLHSPTALAALSLAFVPFAPDAVPLAFGPEPGTAVEKRIGWTIDVTTTAFELELGGQRMEQGLGLHRVVEYEMELADVPVAVVDGRPSELLRAYRKVERHQRLEGEEDDPNVEVAGLGDYESDLQGHRVRFHWDAEAESYAREYAPDDIGGGDAGWLAGLEPDVEFLAFLPDKDVEVGDTWRVDPRALRFLLQPGGDVRLHADDKRADEDVPEEGLAVIVPSVRLSDGLDDLEGTLEVQLFELEGEAGSPQRAVLHLRAEARAEGDLAAQLAERFPDREPYDKVERDLMLLGEGELTWDLSKHRAVRLEFRADVTLSMEAEWTAKSQVGDVPLKLSTADEGSFRFVYEAD